MKVFVVADVTDRDGGYVTQRLVDRGAEIVELDRDRLPTFESLSEPALVLLLGSERSAHDPAQEAVVRAESQLVVAALHAAVAVMAICYGSQLAARALGGTSYRSDDVEVGWSRVDSLDPVLCPEGPWAQFHQDVFVPPPAARVLGTSWVGPQAFVDESHAARLIAWQFHPEVTPPTFERWLAEEAALVRRAGRAPSDLADEARRRAADSRSSAFALVDAALEFLGVDL